VILLGWTAAWGQTPAPEVDPADKSASVNADQQTIAKQLNHPPLGFALALKKPFDGGQEEFQVNFTITYYFR